MVVVQHKYTKDIKILILVNAALDWLQDGLSTNQTDEKVKCESTHLTAFSVLLDADPSYYLPEEHKEALSIISYIGSVFSIIGLLLTIITYSLFR